MVINILTGELSFWLGTGYCNVLSDLLSFRLVYLATCAVCHVLCYTVHGVHTVHEVQIFTVFDFRFSNLNFPKPRFFLLL